MPRGIWRARRERATRCAFSALQAPTISSMTARWRPCSIALKPAFRPPNRPRHGDGSIGTRSPAVRAVHLSAPRPLVPETPQSGGRRALGFLRRDRRGGLDALESARSATPAGPADFTRRFL